LLLSFVLAEATSAYQQAITATDPCTTGVFTWAGVCYAAQ
jgi:hypothetical protein